MADDTELTEKQQIAILIRALDTRGRAIKVAFAFCGVLLVALIVSLQVNTGLRQTITRGRDERRSYQAEARYLECFLADDDVEIAPPSTAEAIMELCEGYSNLEEARETEGTRGQDGKLPQG